MSSYIFLFRPVSVNWSPTSEEPISILCESCFLGSKKKSQLSKVGPGSYTVQFENEFCFWEYPDVFSKDSVQLKVYTVNLGLQSKIATTSLKLRDLYSVGESGHALFQSFKIQTTKAANSNNNKKWRNPFVLFKKNQYNEISKPIDHCNNIVITVEYCIVSVDAVRGRKKSLSPMSSLPLLHHFVGKRNSKVLSSILSGLSSCGVLKQCLKCENGEGMNTLQAALIVGDFETAHVLLSRCGFECFPSHQHSLGNVIHLAVYGHSVKCLKLILNFLKKYDRFSEEGFSIDLFLNQRNGIDDSPLSLACKDPFGNAMAESLISHGADVSLTVDCGNKTPLICACISGSLETVRLLMSVLKSESELLETSECIVLSLQQKIGFFSSFDNKRLAAMFENRLMTYQCNPSFTSPSSGRQALHEAVIIGNFEIVEALIKYGVSIEICDGTGNTIFHLALLHKQIALFKKLLELEKDRYNRFSSREGCLNTMRICKPLLLMKNTKGLSVLNLVSACKDDAEFVENTLTFIKETYFHSKVTIEELSSMNSVEYTCDVDSLQECDSAFEVQYDLALTALMKRTLDMS